MEKSSVGYLSNPLCRRRPHVAVGQFLTIIQTLAHTQSAKTAPLRWRRARHVTITIAIIDDLKRAAELNREGVLEGICPRRLVLPRFFCPPDLLRDNERGF